MGSSKSNGRSLHPAKATGKVFRDGNGWCATGPGFINPAESASDAVIPRSGPMTECALADPYWAGMIIPAFQNFRIEH